MNGIDRNQGLARQIAQSLQADIMQGRLGVTERCLLYTSDAADE